MNNSCNDYLCNDLPEETKKESKYLSKFFFVFVTVYLAVYGMVLICSLLMSRNIVSGNLYNILINLLSGLVVPIWFVFSTRFTVSLKSPRHPVMDTMTVKKFTELLAISVFIMNAGAYVSMLFANVIERISGHIPENTVNIAMSGMSFWEVILYAVVLAPIFEEFLFRKLVIDKLAKFGTVFSVCVSAFAFAVIHANLYQFFYAFGVGALFGYIYCVYGKIIYSVIIHTVVNAIGTLVPLLAMSYKTGVSNAFLIVASAESLVIVFGGILFAIRWIKKENLPTVDGLLVSPYKALFKSAGFWMFVIVFTLELLYSIIA